MLLKEKKYYDNFAEYWDNQFTSLAGRNFRNRKLEFLNDCLKDQKGLCLDVGCATGHFTNKIVNPKLEVVGVDMSQGMIEYAKAKHPNNRFVVCPMQKLSSKFSDVDCIFMMGVFTLEDTNIILSECYKTLRSRGKLVIVSGNRRNFYLRFVFDLLHPSLPSRTVNMDQLETLLGYYGFRVVGHKVFHLIPYFIPDFLFRIAKLIEKRLEWSFFVSCLGSIVGVEAIKL